MKRGIYTLANDRVYDQLIALLNSIEVRLGADFPICVLPYDDRVEKLAMMLAERPHCTLYDDRAVIDKWDTYVKAIWDAHPTAHARWDSRYHRLGTHRRYCAFDGPFDQFIYMDADTLLMGDISQIWTQMETHDWVTYDFQYKQLQHVYEANSPQLNQIFSLEQLRQNIFCSGFYGSKRHVFSETQLTDLLERLQAGEAEILYPMAPDQTILNYLVMRSQIPYCNLALTLSSELRTGCCVTSSHFKEQDHVLYDGDQRLTYMHYIGVSSKLLKRLCNGENIQLPYRDLFLYYRFLHEPDQLPQFQGTPKQFSKPPSFSKRVLTKLGLRK